METIFELAERKKNTISAAMNKQRFGISVRTAWLGVDALDRRQKEIETTKPLPSWLNSALNTINPKRNEQGERIQATYTRPSLGGNLQKGIYSLGKRILNNIVTSQTKGVLLDETDREIAAEYVSLNGHDRSEMPKDLRLEHEKGHKDKIDKLALASARKIHQTQYEAEHPEEIEQDVKVQPVISTPEADNHSRFMHPILRPEISTNSNEADTVETVTVAEVATPENEATIEENAPAAPVQPLNVAQDIDQTNADAEAMPVHVVMNTETGEPMAVQGTGLYTIEEWKDVLDYWSDLTPEELQARKNEAAELRAEFNQNEDPAMNLVIDNASSIKKSYLDAADLALGKLTPEQVDLANHPLTHYFYDTIALGLENEDAAISLDNVANLTQDILASQAQMDAQLALEEAATDFIITENGKLQEVPASEEISLETHEQVILGTNDDGSPRYVWRLREEAPKVEATEEADLSVVDLVQTHEQIITGVNEDGSPQYEWRLREEEQPKVEEDVSAVDLMHDHEFVVVGANEDGSPQYGWKLREEAPKAEVAKSDEDLSIMDLMHTHDYVVTGVNEDGSPQYEWRESEASAPAVDISKLSLEELARTHDYIVTGVNNDGSAQYEWVPNGQTIQKAAATAPAIAVPEVPQKQQDIVAEAQAIAAEVKSDEPENEEAVIPTTEAEPVLAKLSPASPVLTRMDGNPLIGDFSSNMTEIANAHDGSTWKATTTLNNYYGPNKNQHPKIVYHVR